MLKNNVKVLVFAGDVDFICNYLGNKEYLMQTMPKSFGFQSAKDVEIHTESGQKIGLLDLVVECTAADAVGRSAAVGESADRCDQGSAQLDGAAPRGAQRLPRAATRHAPART